MFTSSPPLFSSLLRDFPPLPALSSPSSSQAFQVCSASSHEEDFTASLKRGSRTSASNAAYRSWGAERGRWLQSLIACSLFSSAPSRTSLDRPARLLETDVSEGAAEKVLGEGEGWGVGAKLRYLWYFLVRGRELFAQWERSKTPLTCRSCASASTRGPSC